MSGLSDIRSVVVIMVGHILSVVILQCHQKRDQSLGGYLEGFHQIAFLVQMNGAAISNPGKARTDQYVSIYFEDGVSDGRQGSIARQLGYSEDVDTPTIDLVQIL